MFVLLFIYITPHCVFNLCLSVHRWFILKGQHIRYFLMYILWFLTVKGESGNTDTVHKSTFFYFYSFHFKRKRKNLRLSQNKNPVGSTKPRQLSQSSFEYERRNSIRTPVTWKALHCRGLLGTGNTTAVKHTYVYFIDYTNISF